MDLSNITPFWFHLGSSHIHDALGRTRQCPWCLSSAAANMSFQLDSYSLSFVTALLHVCWSLPGPCKIFRLSLVAMLCILLSLLCVTLPNQWSLLILRRPSNFGCSILLLTYKQVTFPPTTTQSLEACSMSVEDLYNWHRTIPSATDSISFVTFSLQQYQPGIEWVQAIANISRLALLS